MKNSEETVVIKGPGLVGSCTAIAAHRRGSFGAAREYIERTGPYTAADLRAQVIFAAARAISAKR